VHRTIQRPWPTSSTWTPGSISRPTGTTVTGGAPGPRSAALIALPPRDAADCARLARGLGARP
jgi:hypothetical protein